MNNEIRRTLEALKNGELSVEHGVGGFVSSTAAGEEIQKASFKLKGNAAK